MGREKLWTVREYQNGDEERLFELEKAVFPDEEPQHERWIRRWRWMYKDNPTGQGRIWLADHDGKIAGQYPLIFMKMKVRDEIVIISQNIGLMTHPSYRGQGIMSTLECIALDGSAKAGANITIGFPNEPSYPIHIKSGWFDISTMQLLFKPLNWTNAIKLKVTNKFMQRLLAIGASLAFNKVLLRTQRPPEIRGLRINQVDTFDDRVNEFCTKISSQYQIMVVRDKSYLNWRYAAVPDLKFHIYLAEKENEIQGYLVSRAMQRDKTKVGLVFDVLANSTPIAQHLISEAMEQFRREKVDLVYYEMIRNEKNKIFYKAFTKNGFLSAPFMKGMKFCAYSRASDIPKGFLQDPKNWLVHIGDSDAL